MIISVYLQRPTTNANIAFKKTLDRFLDEKNSISYLTAKSLR